MVLSVDESPTDKVLEKLNAIEGIEKAVIIEL